MIDVYVDSPVFYGDTELSATDLNTLLHNGIVLDAISLRGKQGFASNIKRTNWNEGERTLLRLFRGGFKYMTGITTATFRLLVNTAGPEHINIYFKRESDPESSMGTSVYLNTSPNNGLTPYDVNIDLTPLGYNMNEVIEVLVRVENGYGYLPKTGIFQVLDAYVHPLSGVTFYGSYPGLPSFTGDTSISETDLNQIANTSDWLMRRMRLAPRIPFQSLRFWPGTHKAETYPLFRGTVMRSNGSNVARIPITSYFYNVTDYVKVYVNGTLVSTIGPYTVGNKVFNNVYYDMSALSADVAYSLHIDNEPTSGNPANQTYNQNSIFQIGPIDMIPAGYNYAYASPPDDFEMLESMNFSTLKTRLTALKDLFAGVKSRIDANPTVWNRQQMFRSRYSNDEHQDKKWTRLMIASQTRVGSVLLVRGKGIKIAWGNMTIVKDFQTKQMEDEVYTFAHEEEIINGEAFQTKLIYLDQFDGLYPGTVYHITGKELIYCAEYLNNN